MLHLLRRCALSLAATTACLAIGASAASSDVALQNTNLGCNDGTNLNLALDPTALTDLTNAVTAINLYPAGDPALTCNLSQTDPSSTSNDPHDFAVGGGQFINPSRGPACEQNFAISAHSPDSEGFTTDVSGTANLSVPNSPACTGGMGRLSEGGNLVTKVDCLSVNGNTADFTSKVTKATGTFADEGITPGTETSWEVKDLHNGMPPAPDEINVNPFTFQCGGFAPATPATFSVDHGQITVTDN